MDGIREELGHVIVLFLQGPISQGKDAQLPACPKGNSYQIEAIIYTKKISAVSAFKKFEKCPSWMLQKT